MEEIEVKFLNIDVAAIEKKLAEIGATKKGEFLFRSTVFDYPGFTLDKDGAWLRLRNEGDRVTLAYKRRMGRTSDDGSTIDQGMEEWETEVSDYEKTSMIMQKIGMIVKFSQEKKRVKWEKGRVQFDIDTWPRLPTYLEIEAPSWPELFAAIESLGLNPDDRKLFSTTQVYALNGINDQDYIKMTFDEFVRRENVG